MNILFRPGTCDENIWKSVVDLNEYHLPPRFEPQDVILDIGAHIGAFTYAALDRGAGLVVAVECDTDNANYWRHNLHSACRAEARSVLITAAAWRNDRGSEPVHYAPVAVNTGGGNTLGPEGHPVLGVPFDRLVDLACACSSARRVRLCKFDCEGAEWPCLLTSRRLDLIDELAGEYHALHEPSDWPVASVASVEGPYDWRLLARVLESAGFTCSIEQRPALGHFRAWREGG